MASGGSPGALRSGDDGAARRSGAAAGWMGTGATGGGGPGEAGSGAAIPLLTACYEKIMYACMKFFVVLIMSPIFSSKG
jgi:hypothetical protein